MVCIVHASNHITTATATLHPHPPMTTIHQYLSQSHNAAKKSSVGADADAEVGGINDDPAADLGR